MNFNGRVYEHAAELVDGVALVVEMPQAGPAALAIHPGAGATVLCEMTHSPKAALNAGTARWLPVAVGTAGVISAALATDIPAPGPTAFRFTSTGAGSVVEVLQ
jgi:hypothetical protein